MIDHERFPLNGGIGNAFVGRDLVCGGFQRGQWNGDMAVTPLIFRNNRDGFVTWRFSRPWLPRAASVLGCRYDISSLPEQYLIRRMRAGIRQAG